MIAAHSAAEASQRRALLGASLRGRCAPRIFGFLNGSAVEFRVSSAVTGALKVK